MEIDPGSVLTEQLLDQRMANDALLMINNDERNLSLLHRIDAFMASTDEVKQWFFALDPLDERLPLALQEQAVLGHAGPLQDTIYLKVFEASCAEKGGAVLAASAAIDGLPDSGTPYWYPAAHQAFADTYSKRGYQIHETNTASPQELAAFALDQLSGKELDQAQLDDVLLAAEMFVRASTSRLLRESLCVMNSSTGQEILPVENIGKDIIIADALLEAVIQNVAEKPMPSPDGRVTALKAAALATALRLNITDKDGNKLYDHNATLTNYIAQLGSAFTGEGSLRGEISKADHKGLLHEFDWMLDMLIVKYAENHYYNVYPSLSSQDRPLINRPKLNRAYDFVMVNEEFGMAIQLKSSKPHFQKEYHPGIAVLSEENFLDINERRLTAKLRAYQTLIAREFEPSAWAEAKKYVLPTATAAIKAFEEARRQDQTKYFRHQPHSLVSPARPPLNRAERRRLQRQQRRKLS